MPRAARMSPDAIGRSSRADQSEVAHAVALGTEVVDVVRVDGGVQVDAGDHVEAGVGQGCLFERVVRDQAEAFDAEISQDGGADFVVPVVDREPERQVGVERVVPALLQGIGANLVGQADAASFVAAKGRSPLRSLPRRWQ